MSEFLKFRADDPTQWRVNRACLFYKDNSEMMRNAVLLLTQDEEMRVGVDGYAGRIKPVARTYETYKDLPPGRKADFDEYTRLLDARATGESGGNNRVREESTSRETGSRGKGRAVIRLKRP